MKTRLIFITLLLCYQLTGLAQTVPAGTQTTTVITTPAATQPLNTTVTTTTVPIGVSTAEDDRIVVDIYRTYSSVSALIGTSLNAKSVNGIVTISGTVTSQSQADAAISAAKTVPGVKDVLSNISVTTNPDLNRGGPAPVNY